MPPLITILIASCGLLLAIGTITVAIRSRKGSRRIAFAITSVMLTVITVFLCIWSLSSLLTSPSLTLVSAAPVSSSLTMYFTQTSSGSHNSLHDNLVALHVKDGSTRYTRSRSVATTDARDTLDQLSDGALYSEGSVVAGSTPYTIVKAWRPHDGSVIWQKKVEANAISPLFVRDKMIYVASVYGNVIEMDGLRESDGIAIWQRVLQKPADIITLNLSIVAYDNGMVYLSAKGDGAFYLTAFRASDGELFWQSTRFLGDPIHVIADSGMVFISDEVYNVGSFSAYRGDTGQYLWEAPRANSATIVDGVIYALQNIDVVSQYNLVNQTKKLTAMRERDGKVLWQRTEDDFTGNFQIVGDVIYAIRGDNLKRTSSINAFRLSDGTLLWSSVMQYIKGFTAAPGIVYVDQSGKFIALRANDGVQAWQHQGSDNNTVYGKFQVVDGALIVPSISHGEYCVSYCGEGAYINVLNAVTGETFWRYKIADDNSDPVIVIAQVA